MSERNKGYFENLPKLTQNMVKRVLTEAFSENVSADTYGNEGGYTVDEVECHSRDGFTAFDHNRGGLEVRGFTDLSTIWGSGYYPSNSKSRAKVEATVEYTLKLAREGFYEKNTAKLNALGITDAEQCDYNTLQEKGRNELAEELSEYENENLSCDSSTVMYSFRIMYHGQDEKGIHTASVSCALNTEAPYHRSKYDDNAKEVEISWRKGSALKAKLVKAVKAVAKEVL